MKRPPAFQFYTDDFLGGTMHFTDAEVGLYIRLLCVQWSTGSIPDDDVELACYGRGDTPLHRIKAKFTKGSDGRLRNERLEYERQKQADYRAACSNAGKAGADKRWGGHSDPITTSMGSPMGSPIRNDSLPVSCLPSPASGFQPPATATATKPPMPPIGERRGGVEGSENHPSWEQVRHYVAGLAQAGADYTEAEAKGAFLALQAGGWMWGRRPVSDYRAAIERQIQSDRDRTAKPNGNGHKPHSIFELKQIIEAKTKLADDLKRKHCSEAAISSDWSNTEAKTQWRTLRQEIKSLTSQIASHQ